MSKDKPSEMFQFMDSVIRTSREDLYGSSSGERKGSVDDHAYNWKGHELRIFASWSIMESRINDSGIFDPIHIDINKVEIHIMLNDVDSAELKLTDELTSIVREVCKQEVNKWEDV